MSAAFVNYAETHFDDTTNVTSVSLSTLTISAGSNLALIAKIVQYHGALPAGFTVMWGSQTMTLIESFTDTNTDYYCGIWGLVNPATGNQTLTASWTTGTTEHGYIAGEVYSGVDQTGGTTSFYGASVADSTGTSTSYTMTSATGDLVSALAASIGNLTGAASPAVTLWTDSASYNNAASGYVAGSASTTITFDSGTSQLNCVAGFGLKAAATSTNWQDNATLTPSAVLAASANKLIGTVGLIPIGSLIARSTQFMAIDSGLGVGTSLSYPTTLWQDSASLTPVSVLSANFSQIMGATALLVATSPAEFSEGAQFIIDSNIDANLSQLLADTCGINGSSILTGYATALLQGNDVPEVNAVLIPDLVEFGNIYSALRPSAALIPALQDNIALQSGLISGTFLGIALIDIMASGIDLEPLANFNIALIDLEVAGKTFSVATFINGDFVKLLGKAGLNPSAIFGADVLKLIGPNSFYPFAGLSANLSQPVVFNSVASLAPLANFNAELFDLEAAGNSLPIDAFIAGDFAKLLGNVGLNPSVALGADVLKLIGPNSFYPFAGLSAVLSKQVLINGNISAFALVGADLEKWFGLVDWDIESQLVADAQKLLESIIAWNINSQFGANIDKWIGEVILPIYSQINVDALKLLGQTGLSIDSSLSGMIDKNLGNSSLLGASTLAAIASLADGAASSFGSAAQVAAIGSIATPNTALIIGTSGLTVEFLRTLAATSELTPNSELGAGAEQLVTSGVLLPAIGFMAADIDVYRYGMETFIGRSTFAGIAAQFNTAFIGLSSGLSLASIESQLQQIETGVVANSTMQQELLQFAYLDAKFSTSSAIDIANYFEVMQPRAGLAGKVGVVGFPQQEFAAPSSLQPSSGLGISPIYLTGVTTAISKPNALLEAQGQVQMITKSGMLPGCFMSAAVSLHRILLTKQPPITVQLPNNTIIVKGDIVIDIEE